MTAHAVLGILGAFLLLVAFGNRWSNHQRFLAVKQAFDEIREEVRRERSGETEETMTVFTLKRY